MHPNKINFLPPDAVAAECSQRLTAYIRHEIEQAGPMTFARFMELALYYPGLGYYSAGTHKFGRGGDFVTAPELSTLFSICLAKQCQQVLSTLENGDILEFGAGSGTMALNLLTELERLGTMPGSYYILEISADLAQRQQNLIFERLPHLKSKVHWLTGLPNFPFNGVVLANEVVDAFPVHRFYAANKGMQEMYVDVGEENFVYKVDDLSMELSAYLQNLDVDFKVGYSSECNLSLSGWLSSVDEFLHHGVMLIIDYGFDRSQYYHEDRDSGTLMCYYQHRAHDDPLILLGLQDITAHVDFTAVALATQKTELVLSGYTTQANFLLSCDIIGCLSDITDPELYLKRGNEIKILTSPNEMGELFKVMALTKNFEYPLLGFNLRDYSDRL